MFELFDFDPKASFKNLGEQFDGAFSLEGTEYLFEAKWQKEPVNKADLAIFTDKVRTKLENTLGSSSPSTASLQKALPHIRPEEPLYCWLMGVT